MTLDQLPIGKEARILTVGGQGALRPAPAGHGADSPYQGDGPESRAYGGSH